MRVTVVIPAYNYGSFIGEALNSVFAQTVSVDEIVVIDDGSTDNTPDVLARVKDSRLKIIRTSNQGVSSARNRGLNEACGDVVSFLDADDRWRPEKWERERLLLMAEPEVGAIFSNFVRFSDEHVFPMDQFQFFPELRSVPARPARSGCGSVIEGEAFSHLVAFGEFPTWGGATTFRSSLVRHLRFATELPICEDVHFCLRAYRSTSVAFVTEPLIEVRRHGGNATIHTSRVPAFKLRALRMLEREPLTSAQRAALRRRIGRQLITLGAEYAHAGNVAQALRCYAGAPMYDLNRIPGVAKRLFALPYSCVVRKKT